MSGFNIQMVDLKGQYTKIKEDVDKAILDVVESAAFIRGPEVKEFQSNLEKYLEVKQMQLSSMDILKNPYI